MKHVTPPRRRNGQIRTYCRLIQFALTRGLITASQETLAVYAELQAAKQRIDKNTKDTLTDLDIGQMVAVAQEILGFERGETR